MKTVIIVGNQDIFFRAKLEQLAKSCGGTSRFVTTAEELAEAISSSGEESLVVIDIEKVSAKLGEMMRSTGKAQVVGFYPHVRSELQSSAKDLGLIRAVPRSAIETLVRRYLEMD